MDRGQSQGQGQGPVVWASWQGWPRANRGAATLAGLPTSERGPGVPPPLSSIPRALQRPAPSTTTRDTSATSSCLLNWCICPPVPSRCFLVFETRSLSSLCCAFLVISRLPVTAIGRPPRYLIQAPDPRPQVPGTVTVHHHQCEEGRCVLFPPRPPPDHLISSLQPAHLVPGLRDHLLLIILQHQNTVRSVHTTFRITARLQAPTHCASEISTIPLLSSTRSASHLTFHKQTQRTKKGNGKIPPRDPDASKIQASCSLTFRSVTIYIRQRNDSSTCRPATLDIDRI